MGVLGEEGEGEEWASCPSFGTSLCGIMAYEFSLSWDDKPRLPGSKKRRFVSRLFQNNMNGEWKIFAGDLKTETIKDEC